MGSEANTVIVDGAIVDAVVIVAPVASVTVVI